VSNFLEALRSGRVLLMDGAMGTELQRAGLRPGECGERWNLTHPDRVHAIHQAYVSAGAEVLLTNTFQANPAVLRRHGAEGECEVVCRAAVQLARTAAGPRRWVVADIGPFSTEEEWEATPRLAAALAAADPDAFLVETCSEPTAVARFLKALPDRSPGDAPVLLSLTYRRERQGPVRTVRGLSPGQAASRVEPYGVAALGVNCGREIGMPQILDIVEDCRVATSLRLFARPNAGTPRQAEGGWVYPHTPEYMASWLPELLEAGVSMVGGCCGTTPDHIVAFRPVIAAWNARRAEALLPKPPERG
jgi:5-methyltetrahydrofolate--homocysteine methyltransferase